MDSVVGLLRRQKLRRGCWHCWLQAQDLHQQKLLLLLLGLLLGVLQAELDAHCTYWQSPMVLAAYAAGVCRKMKASYACNACEQMPNVAALVFY
jgi:hypothetical protein